MYQGRTTATQIIYDQHNTNNYVVPNYMAPRDMPVPDRPPPKAPPSRITGTQTPNNISTAPPPATPDQPCGECGNSGIINDIAQRLTTCGCSYGLVKHSSLGNHCLLGQRIVTFGKHKDVGKTFSQVYNEDKSYVTWVLGRDTQGTTNSDMIAMRAYFRTRKDYGYYCFIHAMVDTPA